MYRSLLLIIASFFLSTIAIASFAETPAPPGVLSIPDKMPTTCEVSHHRLYVEYRQNDFGNVTEVRRWCQNFMDHFKLDSDRFEDFCNWNRVGDYGRYRYNGQFVYFTDYPGQPRFFFEPFCD